MNETTKLDINLLLQESKESILDPKGYFSTMPTTGGLTYPILKVLIYGTVAGVLSFLWSIFHVSYSGGMFGGTGFMALIMSVIGAVIGLFIGAVIMLIISAVCKGSTDFEANVRVVAALMVLTPVSAAFGFVNGINLRMAVIIGALISLYGIYMMYHALVRALRCNEKSSKIVSYVLAGIIILFMITGLSGRRYHGYPHMYNETGMVEKNTTVIMQQG